MRKLYHISLVLFLVFTFTYHAGAQYLGGFGSGYDMSSASDIYHLLSIEIEGDGSVTVEAEGEILDPEFSGTNIYYIEDGTEITLTAEPDAEWVFGHWSGDHVPPGQEQEISITLDITSVIILTAKFLKELTITVNPASRVYGEDDPPFSFEDFSGQLIPGDNIADVTGGAGEPDDVEYTLETTDIGSPVGIYPDEIGIDEESLNGDKADDYSIDITRGTLTITERELTLFDFVANDKIYDGTNEVLSGDGFDDDRFPGDILEFEYDVAFEDENAGVDKDVYFTDIILSGGEHADNYTLVTTGGTAIATIFPRDLTLSNFTADDKTYDGTSEVLSGDGFDDDRIPGDILEFEYDVAFEDENAGIDKDVYFTDIIISGGEDMDNYTLVTTGGTAIATIFQRELTIGGSFTAHDKIYDGTTDAEIDEDNLELINYIEFDDVYLSVVVVQFADPGPGTDIEVSITWAELGGEDSDNYMLDYITGAPSTTADIFPKTATLTLFIEGSGTVTINGNSYSAGEQNIELVLYETYTLEANGAAGWIFSHWEGDVENENDPVTSITMDDDKTVTAYFDQVEYTLDISVEGEGSVDVDPDKEIYYYGDEVVLTAIPAEDWAFDTWSGDLTGDNSPVTLFIDDNKEVTAWFVPQVALEINIEGEGTVKVKENDTEITPENGIYKVKTGAKLTLEAIAEEDWIFSHWAGPDAGDLESTTDEITTIIMDSDKSVDAVFDHANIVDEISAAGNIILYPNPARNTITLDVEKGDILISASIINNHGQAMIEKFLKDSHGHTIQTFDISKLDKGLYYIRLLTEKGTISKSFIVQ